MTPFLGLWDTEEAQAWGQDSQSSRWPCCLSHIILKKNFFLISRHGSAGNKSDYYP